MISRFTHLASLPRMRMTTAAEMTEAATLTSSLPIRIVTIRWRGWASSLSIREMLGFAAWRICSCCSRLSENSEVSELEKKAERPIRAAKATSSRTIVISTAGPLLDSRVGAR